MGLPNKLRLGTRGSRLALWQAESVRARLAQAHAAGSVELVPITTTGDRVRGPLAAYGGKALYVKEIEEALLSGTVDLAVHSLKDVPGVLPDGLALVGVTEREDPRDALVLRAGTELATVPSGARIGTASLRRKYQLQGLTSPPQQAKPVGSPPHASAEGGPASGGRGMRARWGDAHPLQGLAYPPARAYGYFLVHPPSVGTRTRSSRSDFVIEPIRGNVETRVRKVVAGEYAALVMAMAGLKRLGIAGDHLQITPLPVDEMIPAIGQGVIAVEGRVADTALAALVRNACHHALTGVVAAAERAVLHTVGGDCYTPLAAHATLEMGTGPKRSSIGAGQMGPVPMLRLRGWLAAPDGTRVARAERLVAIHAGPDAEAVAMALGRTVGEALKEQLTQ